MGKKLRPGFAAMEAVSDDFGGYAGDTQATAPWYRRVGAKMTTLWGQKLAGLLIFTSLFFFVYFLLLRHPLFRVTVMPPAPLDRLIGFYPAALLLYGSLWFYIPLPPLMMVDKGELRAYAATAAGLCLTGLGIFFFWPTRVAPPEVDWANHPGFTLLRSIDRAGNACPSLHAAFAVFSAAELERQLRRNGEPGPFRILNWVWCFGILYSTLATKQHVAWDVLAGGGLGIAAAMLQARARPISA